MSPDQHTGQATQRARTHERPAGAEHSGAPTELAREQEVVSRLYHRLDQLRDRTRGQLADVRRRGASGTPQARSERDAFATLYEDRLAQLNAVEGGLCFGRLDMDAGARHYVGRVGLSDEHHETLLVDWRAPAAEPFYQATPADPRGVRLRRHLRTRGRAVIGIDDDVLDLQALDGADRSTLSGEASLLAALTASRTGRMGDIVVTIQAEQDRVIRSDLDGVLVVQGGPGTGKTAVALHRAAYLLYTHRRRLARSGVLVVGPNAVFLRYIEQVLPALGETGVLLTTPERLLPGVDPTGTEPDEVAVLKGDLRMAAVVRAAVADRQRVLDHELAIPYEEHELRLTPRIWAAARTRARRTRRPHNEARLVFARAVLDALSGQVVGRPGGPAPEEAPYVARELLRVEELLLALRATWPKLTPTELLADLFADPDALDRVAPELTAAERALLRRRPDADWTPADVPLLDEAADLLGDPDVAARRREARRQREEEKAYAAGVLAMTGVAGRVSAERMAARWRDETPAGTVAERAAADRNWTFGHVIVDEAQELSPMVWRSLVRRCPARSMTVVGDVAQRSSPWGASSWAGVLDPFVAGRWRVAGLTVSYRTPAEVMAVAAEVLADLDPTLTPPTPVRDEGERPWLQRVAPDALVDRLADLVRVEERRVGAGTVAVILPSGRYDALGAALRAAVPHAAVGAGAAALDARVAVLTPTEAKGLEFDAVLLVEPAEVHRPGDLYVALTRPTRRLGIVHTGDLPPGLERALAAGLLDDRTG